MSISLFVRGAALAGIFVCALGACSNKHDPPILTASQEAEIAQYVSMAAPESAAKIDIDFDSKIHLIGWEVSPRGTKYSPGSSVKVTLYWRCDQKLEPGWLLFTHLLNHDLVKVDNLDESGPLRKMDGVVGQPLPPSRWEPGKYYRDELSFAVPADPSPELVVSPGIYRGDQRLPILSGAAKDGRALAVRLATGARDPRTAIKEITVSRMPAHTTLVIDGKLDEPIWASAPSTGPFVDVGTGRENPALPVQGNAKLLWDDTFLYAGFDVADAKVRGGWPKDAKDPHLWERDTVELMIDPDGDGDNKDYYEIQINPQNLVFDTQYDSYNFPNGGGKGPFGHEEWSAGLTSAVAIHGTIDDDSDVDKGYTVEVKIPWASFTKANHAPPLAGDAWRMNFYAMQDNGGTAWSPILGTGNFHRASRFGRVKWMIGDAAAPPSSSGSAAASALAPAPVDSSGGGARMPSPVASSGAGIRVIAPPASSGAPAR